MQMPVTIRGPALKRENTGGSGGQPIADVSACGFCGERGATKRCSRCRRQCYCDAACQRAAWAEHKTVCNAMLDDEVLPF